jgi:hypothetical protein
VVVFFATFFLGAVFFFVTVFFLVFLADLAVVVREDVFFDFEDEDDLDFDLDAGIYSHPFETGSSGAAVLVMFANIPWFLCAYPEEIKKN